MRPLTEEERQLYKVLSGVIQTPASTLSAKWREPSLTIHDVRTAGATSQSFRYDLLFDSHSNVVCRLNGYTILGHRPRINPSCTRSGPRHHPEDIAGTFEANIFGHEISECHRGTSRSFCYRHRQLTMWFRLRSITRRIGGWVTSTICGSQH